VDELIDSAFAAFALQQELLLAEIAEGVGQHQLPEARSQSPEWFAHGASEDDLLALAPELQAEFASAEGDLVALYGGSDRLNAAGVGEAKVTTNDDQASEQQTVRIDLLKEISGLDD